VRLSVEETLRNLKQVEEKYKIRFTPTGEVNISEMARDCIDTIEVLQQENEKLKATLADWKYNAKCDADHIAALTADKDELSRKTRQLEEGLRSTLKVLETLNYRGGLGLDIHKWLRDEMQTVNALLGG
jgi:FtsZ-binding cell division protein ZapB